MDLEVEPEKYNDYIDRICSDYEYAGLYFHLLDLRNKAGTKELSELASICECAISYDRPHRAYKELYDIAKRYIKWLNQKGKEEHPEEYQKAVEDYTRQLVKRGGREYREYKEVNPSEEENAAQKKIGNKIQKREVGILISSVIWPAGLNNLLETGEKLYGYKTVYDCREMKVLVSNEHVMVLDRINKFVYSSQFTIQTIEELKAKLKHKPIEVGDIDFEDKLKERSMGKIYWLLKEVPGKGETSNPLWEVVEKIESPEVLTLIQCSSKIQVACLIDGDVIYKIRAEVQI
jgi:hypothetical protein